MLSDSNRFSIALLNEVLAGSTYGAAAGRYGISRTAVELRVKRIVKQLQLHVGIDGLSPQASVYVQKLRASKEKVHVALSLFETGQRRALPPLTLSNEDIRWIFSRVSLRGGTTALRDCALTHILFATGARPLEIARLQIGDYLLPNGEIRKASVMRAEASVNRVPRPLIFQSVAATAAIDIYLETRRVKKTLNPIAAYRGFTPEDSLFLNDKGEPFAIVETREKCGQQYLCREILDVYRKIFNRVGMNGLSSSVIRRNVVLRMYGRGADEKQISEILGINDLQAIKAMLPPRLSLEKIMEDIYVA